MGKPSMVNSEKYRVSAHLPDSFLIWGTVDAVGEQILRAGADETLAVEMLLAKPIPAGHTVEVWSHFVSDMERPQAMAPDGRAFFSYRGDIAATTFVRPEAKVHGSGSFFPYRRYAGVYLEEEAPVGSRFVFQISDVSMQTYEETLFNLRIAILDGDRVVGYLGDAFYVVKGAALAQLYVVAPTCVEVGKPFDIKIVTRDRFGNKSCDPPDALAFDVVLDEGKGTLTFDEISLDAKWLYHIVRGVTLDADGPHYVGVCARTRVQGGSAVCGVSNPIAVRESWPERVVWGDMHQHTDFADGRGTPAANIEYAISTSCLDFVTIAAHQELTFNPPLVRMAGAPPQTGWEDMQAAAEAYNGADIVAILGSEAGVLGPVAGHMNSYYVDVDNRPEFERMGLFFRSGEHFDVREHDPATFYVRYLTELERSNGEFLLLPHAHACGGPGRFELPKRPTYQTNVEVVSVHGVFEACYHEWLRHGHFVGVHGGGDNHMTSTGNGNPGWHYPNTNGLAAALVKSRTRKGIFDAFRGRKTYAVTGNQRIHLEFSIDDAEMGDIVVCEETHDRHIACHVAGTMPVMKVELFRNNVVIATHTPSLAVRDTLRLSWTDSWGSRRVDDSETTGTIALESGSLDVVETLHEYHRTDRIAPVGDGTLSYRTNGYSGITRGAILAVTADDADPDLRFAIHDVHLDTVLLDETLVVPLAERQTVVTLPLGDQLLRPCFTREPVRPEFTLEADWIDTAWPKVIDVEWTDAESDGAFYYVRVEQIDGNLAWSSPIWFVDGAVA